MNKEQNIIESTNAGLSTEPAIDGYTVLPAVPSSEVYLEDCVKALKRFNDNHFDLAIVDPPYGIEIAEWDKERPTDEYWEQLFRVSKNQIVWGGNYFADLLPPKKGWIFWDKKITNSNNTNFSDGELAWTSFDCILRRFTYDWIGFGYLNNPQGEKKIHPTQKPVSLYKWILENYAEKGSKILDTHLGSGSIAIACWDMGYDLTAYEVDKEYYDNACKRLETHKAQLTLW